MPRDAGHRGTIHGPDIPNPRKSVRPLLWPFCIARPPGLGVRPSRGTGSRSLPQDAWAGMYGICFRLGCGSQFHGPFLSRECLEGRSRNSTLGCMGPSRRIGDGDLGFRCEAGCCGRLCTLEPTCRVRGLGSMGCLGGRREVVGCTEYMNEGSGNLGGVSFPSSSRFPKSRPYSFCLPFSVNILVAQVPDT